MTLLQDLIIYYDSLKENLQEIYLLALNFSHFAYCYKLFPIIVFKRQKQPRKTSLKLYSTDAAVTIIYHNI